MAATRVVFFLALLVACSADSSSYVVELTDQNFDDLTSSGSWLLEFFAPWCGHCKHLAPVFEEVAEEVRNKEVRLGKIDCTVEKGLQTKFDIKSYPTLKFMRDGEHRPYTGDRTKEAFLSFIDAVTGPPVIKLKNATIPTDKAVTFVYVGNSGPEQTMYEKVARQLQGLHVFYSVNAYKAEKISQQYNIKLPDEPTVLWFSPGADIAVFPGPWEEARLRDFIASHALPLLSELNGSNFHQLTSSPKLLILAATHPASSKTNAYLASVLTVAKEYQSKFVFANIDAIKFDKYLAQFGINEENIPLIFAFDYKNELFWPSTEEYPINSIDKVRAFLDAVYDGTLPGRSVAPWYSPARFVRWFEKWMSQFTDIQLAIGSSVVMVVVAGLVIWLCCGAVDDERREEIRRLANERQKREDREEEEDAPADKESENAADSGPRRRGGKKEKQTEKAKPVAAEDDEDVDDDDYVQVPNADADKDKDK